MVCQSHFFQLKECYIDKNGLLFIVLSHKWTPAYSEAIQQSLPLEDQYAHCVAQWRALEEEFGEDFDPDSHFGGTKEPTATYLDTICGECFTMWSQEKILPRQQHNWWMCNVSIVRISLKTLCHVVFGEQPDQKMEKLFV